MINAPQFAEEPTPHVVGAIAREHDNQYYWRVAFFNKESWAKALTGRAEYGAIWRALRAKLSGSLGSPSQSVETGADVRAFEQLSERGVKLMLLLSEVDWGLNYLRAILGDHFEEWARVGNPRLEVFHHADHMMTPLASQERTRKLFVEWADWL